MAATKKIALKGLSRVKVFPITANTSSEYTPGVGFDVPWIEEMTREPDVTSEPVFSDDVKYLDVKNINGWNSTLTFTEMPLEMIEKFGFGTLDAATGVFTGKPEGSNLSFGMTFRMLNVSSEYRMFRYYVFTPSELKEGNAQTKGASININRYQLVGVFTPRLKDGVAYSMKDTAAETSEADMLWLDWMTDAP